MNKWWLYSVHLPLISFSVIRPIAAQQTLAHYEPWFPNQNINSDWKNIYYSNFITTNHDQNLINNNNVNLQHQRNYLKYGAGNGGWNSHGFKTIGQINWKNYAASKASFINNYQLNLNFQLSYNSWTSDWGWANPISGSNGNNLRFNNENYTQQIANNSVNKYKEYIEEGRKTHSQISFQTQWSGDVLLLQVHLESKSWWNWGSWIEHAAIICFKLNYLQITSKFSTPNLQSRLQQGFANEFTLNTKTSPQISSNDKTSVDGATKSNQELIDEEITRRLKNILSIDYNEWIKQLSVEKQYLNQQNLVKLTFIDASNQVPSNVKKAFDSLALKVKVNLLPQFWQKSLKERLEITPGKIVNPQKNENELITDNPEFIKQGNKEIYIYHNSVKLSFTSSANSGEVLFVNGQEVEVYNNIFNIDLLDTGIKKNTYEIVVKQKDVVKMQLTIKIATQNEDTHFKWLGWNPENNPDKPNEYKQWKLITSTINGEANADYDSTVNPKTGLRNQMIFVNQKSRYPFPLNPLDKFGRLIKDNKQNYMQGYIAEAMVANSGIQNIFSEKDLEVIAKIERVQINPKTFMPIGSSQVIDIKNEKQFSSPGLWHYIYYIKDFVKQPVNPKAINAHSIMANAGSTMHKFILIGNQLGDYAEFLKQQDIFNNHDLEYFWSSMAGKHLKSFLKNERNISLTNQINQLEYKEIIRYWKEYVSSAVNEQIDRKDEFELFALDKLNLKTLRVNTTDKKVLFKEIANHLTSAIKKYARNSQYEVDYYVANELTQNLNQIDWQEFLNVTESDKFKQIDLIVASSHQSLYVKGKTSFTIINDLKYDAKKMFDLSLLKIGDIKYNFFDAQDEVKQTFKTHYILNYINNILTKNKPKNIKDKYVYEQDYHIWVTFPDNQKLSIDDKNIEEKLQLFLNTEKYQSFEIEIVANPQSYLLENQTNYTITNDPSDIIAPIIPEIGDDKDDKLIQSLMWIIPTAIGGAIVLSLGIFFVVKRFKRKVK